MKVHEIHEAEATYNNCAMRLYPVYNDQQRCDGCDQCLPMGGFYIRGKNCSLCVDCAESFTHLRFKMTKEQLQASKAVFFKDPDSYLDTLRVSRSVEGNYAVKFRSGGSWHPTTKEYFDYCLNERKYQQIASQSSPVFEVYGLTNIEEHEQPEQP